MTQHPLATAAHDAAWEERFLDSARFAHDVELLPPGPVTDYLRARVAQVEGRVDDALHLCDAAEDGLTEPTIWRARLLETRGNLLTALGMNDEAQSMLAAAWELYEQLDDPVGRASIRQNTAVLGFQPYETARQLFHEALDLAEQAGRADLVGIILLNLAGVAEDSGAPREEREALARRADAVLDGVWPSMQLRARSHLLHIALEAGDLVAARRQAAQLPDPRDVADRSVRTHLGVELSALWVRDGHTEHAAAVLEGLLDGSLVPRDRPLVRRTLAEALAASGRWSEAAQSALHAYDELDEVRAAEGSATGRALDVFHRTAQLRKDREREAERADTLETALRELRMANRRIHELSVRDTVTGLHNRQYLMDHAPLLLDGATAQHPGALALIDLDHFKQVNDSHGHGTGDDVLRCYAQALRDHLPEGDLVARYGGEEFVVVRAPGPDGDAHLSLRADLGALRRHLATTPWTTPDGRALPSVTMSTGLTSVTADGVRAALARADVAMYAAKHAGRDCLRLADDLA